MECRTQPQRGRGRRGRTHSSWSTASFPSRSHGFQSNPTKIAGSSNPNQRHDHDGRRNLDYKNKSTQLLNQEEDDDSFSSVPSIVGTCPYMCPDEERSQRERLRDLAVFERLNRNLEKTSATLAVKKFCRTISTKHLQASDIRPLPVLDGTLNYLLNLLYSKEYPFEVVHDFIFDRTRSIRQDLSMQNIIDDQAVHMYEKMVRFHVISHHMLRRCGGNPNISSMQYLNMEQLTKVLTSLYNLYEANRSSHSSYENEAEFRSLYVLLHLGSDSQPMRDSLSLWLRHVPSPILKLKEMCFARTILRYFRLGNYKRFICTTAAEASFLQYCIIEPYINEIRGMAIACINYGGYKLHPYPLSDLSKLLMMKESDVESICSDCGLEVSTDELGNKFLPAKQTTFCHPKGGFQNYCLLGSEWLDMAANDLNQASTSLNSACQNLDVLKIGKA